MKVGDGPDVNKSESNKEWGEIQTMGIFQNQKQIEGLQEVWCFSFCGGLYFLLWYRDGRP